MFEEAEPLTQRIVGWRLGATATPQDREDIVGDVLVDLLSRMDLVRRGEANAIADLSAYTAVAAHHACDRYLRRRFPLRYRLGTRVRYLFETSKDYRLWQAEGGWICARLGDQDKAAKAPLAPGWVKEVALKPPATEARAVASIFEYLNAPARLSDVVEGVAVLLNVRDLEASADDLDLAAKSENRERQLEHRQTLEALWKEIQELPRPQRFALLLNLRDEEGLCALTSLPWTGVATMRQIAAAVELPAEELAGLWARLPLSDLEIAGRLGLTRQQVINLRKAARQRLARRMAGNIGARSDSSKGKSANRG